LLLGHESVAAVEGLPALLANPAALGTRYPAELLLALEEVSGRAAGGHALAGWRGLGVGVADPQSGPASLVLGAAAQGRKLRLGWSTAWLRGPDRIADHRLGLLIRPSPWLSLGAAADHLAEPRLDGARLGRRYRLGAGLRPLALSRQRAFTLGPRLTATCDLELAEDRPAAGARVRLGGELEPLPGLLLRGSTENPGGLRLGLTLLAPRTAYHGHSARDRSGTGRGTTHALSFHGAEDRTVLFARGRIAEVRVAGALGDEALSGFSLLGGGATVSSAPLHRQLERARRDPRTRGVLLDLRSASTLAQLEELRPRIARLRAAGKPVVAYLEYGGGRGDLFLAAACDRVLASEGADFAALGLRVERRYWRRLLADWGVRMDRSATGPFKSAYRNFSADSTPPQDREAIEHHLDVLQSRFVATLATDRGIPEERLAHLLDGRWWPAEELVRAGVLDTLGYREDARRVLGRLTGLGDKPPRVDLERLAEARRAWLLPRRLAVVYASGGIEVGRSGHELLNGDYMGSETVAAQLERAFRDREVEAVVLRVESPGGSSLGSDLIHHAARRLKRETGKPLVVSMGSMAASGGYQISVAGDRLYAGRFTRTGSIGVVYVKPSLEGWYENHRVRQDAFERGPHMGAWSLGRDWTPRWQAAADSAVEYTYRRFLAKVAEGRRLPLEEVEAAAGGRVWMGEEALERRLVDAIGGLEEALLEARRLAGVPAAERIEPLELRRPPPRLLRRLLGAAAREGLGLDPRFLEPGAVELRADLEAAP
jgi:protease-4